MPRENYEAINEHIQSFILEYPPIKEWLDKLNTEIKSERSTNDEFSQFIVQAKQDLLHEFYTVLFHSFKKPILTNASKQITLDSFSAVDITDLIKKYNYTFVWNDEDVYNVAETVTESIEDFTSKFKIDTTQFEMFRQECAELIMKLLAPLLTKLGFDALVPFGQILSGVAEVSDTTVELVKKAFLYNQSKFKDSDAFYCSLYYNALCTSIEDASKENVEDAAKDLAIATTGLLVGFVPFGIGAILNTIKDIAAIPLAVYAMFEVWKESNALQDKLSSPNNFQTEGEDEPKYFSLGHLVENPILSASFLIHGSDINTFNELNIKEFKDYPDYMHSNLVDFYTQILTFEHNEKLSIVTNNFLGYATERLNAQLQNEKTAATAIIAGSPFAIILTDSNGTPAVSKQKSKKSYSDLVSGRTKKIQDMIEHCYKADNSEDPQSPKAQVEPYISTERDVIQKRKLKRTNLVSQMSY
jgi:hypothetical protein